MTTKNTKTKANSAEVKEEVVKENIVEQPKKARTIDNDDLIDVMNYTQGKLVYINPRSQQEWIFENFGVVDRMSFSELKTMKATQSKFLFEPWLIPLDELASELLGLTRVHENILKLEEIDMFFQMNETDMEKFLSKAPNNMKMLIIKLTQEKIRNKEFSDLFKIRLIENLLKCQLLD